MSYSLIHMTQKPYALTKRQVMQLIDSTAEAPKFGDLRALARDKIVSRHRMGERPDLGRLRETREEMRIEINKRIAFLNKLAQKRHWEWEESDFSRDERAEWLQVKRKLDKREREICKAVLASQEAYDNLPQFVKMRAEDAAIEAVRSFIDGAMLPRKSISSSQSAMAKLFFSVVAVGAVVVWRVGHELLEAIKKDPFFFGALFVGIPAAIILRAPYQLIKTGRHLYRIGIEIEDAIFDALDKTIKENNNVLKNR